jgi:hypothetical protein
MNEADVKREWVEAGFTKLILHRTEQKLKQAIDVVLRAGDVSTDPKVARAVAEVRALESNVRLLSKGES